MTKIVLVVLLITSFFICGCDEDNDSLITPEKCAPSDEFIARAEAAIDWAEDRAEEKSYEWWDAKEEQSYCLRFVANAYMQQYAEGKSGWGSAIEASRELELFDSEENGWLNNAPRGALIFFGPTANNSYGHVGIYLGNGRIVHAFGMVRTDAEITDVLESIYVGDYLGWACPPKQWTPQSNSEPTTIPWQETLSVVDSIVLDQGDNLIHGFIYYNGMLWASTRTSPGRILRIDPDTLEYDRIILDSGMYNIEDIIGIGDYIWAITCTNPSKIIKIHPETLEWTVAISFTTNEMREGGSLEYAFGYLWAGGRPGRIARIDLATNNYKIYDYSDEVGTSQFHALTSGEGYIWGSTPHYRSSWSGGEYYASTIVRIEPQSPNNYRATYIEECISDDIAYAGSALFIGSEENPSRIYRIDKELTVESVIGHDTVCYGVFPPQSQSTFYISVWAAFVGSPGMIAEFLPDMSMNQSIMLPAGFNNANEIAFDNKGNIFVTCWQSPARIVKLR